jgi:O-antigen/teichoic acid export membrane protein
MGVRRASRGEERSLRVAFVWSLAGNLTYAGCQWAMLMVLAKMTSPEVVGQYALALAVTGPVFMFANLQLRAVQATDARGHYHFADYWRLRLVTTALAVVTSTLWAGMGGYGRESALVVLAMTAGRTVDSLADVIAGAFQREERLDLLSRSLIGRSVLGLVAFGGCLHKTGNLLASLLAQACAWGVVVVLHDVPVRRGLATGEVSPAQRLEWRRLGDLARLSLPLGFVMLLVSLNTNLPRYVIERWLGARELGVFAALASALTAGQLVVNALGQSAAPRLSRLGVLAETDQQPFKQLLRKLLIVAGALGGTGVATAWLLGAPVVAMLFTPEYATSVSVLVWIMVAAGIGYLASFLGNAMTALREFRIQVPLLVVTCSVTLGLSLFLVPRHGLIGAAWALVGAATVQMAASGAMILKALRAVGSKSSM